MLSIRDISSAPLSSTGGGKRGRGKGKVRSTDVKKTLFCSLPFFLRTDAPPLKMKEKREAPDPPWPCHCTPISPLAAFPFTAILNFLSPLSTEDGGGPKPAFLFLPFPRSPSVRSSFSCSFFDGPFVLRATQLLSDTSLLSLPIFAPTRWYAPNVTHMSKAFLFH